MFEQKVINTIKKYDMISKGDKIVVAVSGGPDSISLLNVLAKYCKDWNCKIVVAHVNHMIRAVADSETEYVKNFCDNLGIECFVKKIDVIKKAEFDKISTEEEGRNVRYAFFDEVLKNTGANKIAIAHNKNDNVETVLMNVIRGAGVSGLKGIEPVRANKFIRPLIEMDRAEIEQYCFENNLNPKFDESNNENVYTRNKIRNLLIPYLKKEFNPNIIDSISRLSELATIENTYIEDVSNRAFNDVVISQDNKKIILNLKLFNSQEYFIKTKIILSAINKIFGTTKGIEKIHVEDIIKLCERNIGNKFLTPNKNTKVEVGSGKITISNLNS